MLMLYVRMNAAVSKYNIIKIYESTKETQIYVYGKQQQQQLIQNIFPKILSKIVNVTFYVNTPTQVKINHHKFI